MSEAIANASGRDPSDIQALLSEHEPSVVMVTRRDVP